MEETGSLHLYSLLKHMLLEL